MEDGSATETDTVFELNPVAELVWEMVASRESNLASIVDAVCREFEVTEDVAAADVSAFLEQLVAVNALHVSERALD